jgi:type II secretory pathway component PulF
MSKRFDYKAYDKEGAKLSGSIDAESLVLARQQLQQQGLLITQIAEYQPSVFANLSSQKLGVKDQAFLTKELALLLEAGLRVDRGVELLAKTAEKPALRELLQTIATDLKNGKKISQAFGRHDTVFDPLYINLIRIAEETGRLAEVFKGLAADLAYKQDLNNKIKQAMSYPLVILAVCVLSIVFIFNVVVPNLAGMFHDKANLPVYTTMLLGLSAWMIQYQWFLLIGVVATVFGLVRFSGHPMVRHRMESILLNTPLLRQATLQTARIRFNDALALMLQSGVVIDRALQMAAGSVSNHLIRAELIIACDKIKHGARLSVALGQTQLFPMYFASILAVGEEAGELARVFAEIANRSRDNFNQWVARMTTIIEPLMILIMGAIVGGVVVIMMLSITATTDIAL